jgi:hypothetical protein
MIRAASQPQPPITADSAVAACRQAMERARKSGCSHGSTAVPEYERALDRLVRVHTIAGVDDRQRAEHVADLLRATDALIRAVDARLAPTGALT